MDKGVGLLVNGISKGTLACLAILSSQYVERPPRYSLFLLVSYKQGVVKTIGKKKKKKKERKESVKESSG
jgi:hypothetical protein